MIPRPRKVEVGPFTYKILWDVAAWSETFDAGLAGSDPDAVRAIGMTDKRSCTIWINPHADPQYQREALLHELSHAVQFVAGLPNLGLVAGEDYITRSTPLLLDMLRRNKAVAAYLLG